VGMNLFQSFMEGANPMTGSKSKRSRKSDD